MEKRYQFRERLTTSNTPFDFTQRSKYESEISFLDGVTFSYPESAVIRHAAEDLTDFLKDCFNVTERGKDPIRISIELTEDDLGDANAYGGRHVSVKDKEILIRAHDERGAAWAIYGIEDSLRRKKQPYADKGTTRAKPTFSPRMVHSAFGMDNYPEAYLKLLAKNGIDTIMLTLTEVNSSANGYRDVNAIVSLAAEYGIDVYAYWHREIFHSPKAEDAESVYDDAYGRLFREHPGIKGIIFVGEIIQFPSEDKRSTGRQYWKFLNEDGFPDPRPGVSHWPCEDYAEWLDLAKRVIRRAKKDADIVFWTYNWGWAPEEYRIALINRLPTDISLMVTFEMFENLPTSYGITERVCDYTVAFAGPGKYFLGEAAAAKKRGLRLYTQANAGGRTWDFGCMPYEPFPGQWMERYRALRQCNEDYGLVGIMECHQYGFWPSMITKIEKYAYECRREDLDGDGIIKAVIGEFAGDETDICAQALDLWSDAIRMYMPTDHEQYCAMRVGPAYPMTLGLYPTPPGKLMPEGSFFGNSITQDYNMPNGYLFSQGTFTLHSIRIRAEQKILKDIIRKLREGITLLNSMKTKNEEISRLINMGKYMVCCFTTDLNTKKMYIYRQRLSIAPSKDEVRRILAGIRRVGEAEIRNAAKALTCVDNDSALGFEPLMGYAGDRAHIEWKIRQVKHMLTYELEVYEKGLMF